MVSPIRGPWGIHLFLTVLPVVFEVDVLLSETETIWLLDIPSTAVGLDSEEAKSVQERNDKYEEANETKLN